MSEYQDLYETLERQFMDLMTDWVGFSLAWKQDKWILTIYEERTIALFHPLFEPFLPREVTVRYVPLGRLSSPKLRPPETVGLAPSAAIGSPVYVVGAQGRLGHGSIGAYVKTHDGVWLVSANHVLARNGRCLPLGDREHGVYLGSKRVSRTVIFKELELHGKQTDSAACLLDPAAGIVPAWPAGWIPNPTPHTPAPETRVKISVDGVDRFGTVEAIGLFRVSMEDADFPGALGQVQFAGSILVRAEEGFGQPGNSGGLVVTADSNGHPIGLITGHSSDRGTHYVVVSPLAQVLADLRLPGQLLI